MMCVGGGYGEAITFVSWLYLTQHISNEKYAKHILRPKSIWAAFYFTIILSKWPTDTEVTGSIPVEAVIFSTVNGFHGTLPFIILPIRSSSYSIVVRMYGRPST